VPTQALNAWSKASPEPFASGPGALATALFFLEPNGQRASIGLRMAGRMKPSFNCPHCDALYHVVRGEAGPETIYREITCLTCSRPLPERERQFVLKYFLLRKALPRDARAHVGSEHGSVRARRKM